MFDLPFKILGGNTVSSPSYLTTTVAKTLPSERVGSSGSSEVAMPAFSIASNYSSTMPGATAIKVSDAQITTIPPCSCHCCRNSIDTLLQTAGGGLQGGAPSGPGLQTTIHTMQTPPQVITQQQHVILPTQTHQPIRHSKVQTHFPAGIF